MKYFKLNDGNEIPSIGFGTFLIPADGSTYDAVSKALKFGVRHIDTAAAYFNEEEVGRAVRDSEIDREDVWITSKMWLQDYKYEDAKKAIDISLKKLHTDYMDLYLLHQPYGAVDEAWRALEEAKDEGKIKSIGVSNMTPKLWNRFVPDFDTMTSVNQVEFNPYFQQKEIREIMAKDNVKLDCTQNLFAKFEQARESCNVICHESYVCCFDSQITAKCTHCNRTICKCK